jgi:putative phage-type endonuclease
MAIIDYSFEQRDPEWYESRLGNPGCSSMSNIIGMKGEISKSREDYLYALAAESVSRRSDEKYQSQHMINGTEREDSARALFEMQHDCDVKTCGIVWKDEYKLFHCSPDGLVGDNALLEMKNPLGKTVVKNLLDNKLPSQYYVQCQASLYICERDLLYFMSAYDGLPPLIIEVRPDEEFIKKLAVALSDFCADLARLVERLRSIK